MADDRMGTQAVDRMPSPALVPTNGLNPATARPEPDVDAERLRGFVALPHRRAILFTDEVELNAQKLPRWQPHVSVDERRVRDDDHA